MFRNEAPYPLVEDENTIRSSTRDDELSFSDAVLVYASGTPGDYSPEKDSAYWSLETSIYSNLGDDGGELPVHSVEYVLPLSILFSREEGVSLGME